MKVLVSGASGFIGRALASRLRAIGHEVLPLVRTDASAAIGHFDHAACDGADAVVHLAGENIAAGRWTAARMRRIRDSRVEGTRLLAAGLATLERAPATFVQASAIGIYGDRGDETLTEDSARGSGYLPDLVHDWETASASLEARGVRRVVLRIGLVLARDGGALPRIALPFRFFAGGRTGSGRQWQSWITRGDLLAVVERALVDETLHGVYNAVAPSPARNADFARTLGRVLRRPSWLPAPAFALRLALGEMADALLLSSARVVPTRLLAAHFRFADEELEPALRRVFTAPQTPR
ncbi:MAG: TIGR01777 family protein [Planctomycetes bacterium]|nr:TIGR01777 family protein [Planctomycetota bacterium]